MEIDVRPFDGDPRAFFDAGELAFSERPRDEDFRSWEPTFEPERAVAAYDGTAIVGIYQRFGYGLATMATAIKLDRDRSGFRRPLTPAGTVRFVELDEAKRLFPPIYDAIRPQRPGFVHRRPEMWEHTFFRDAEHRREGASAAWHVVHEVAGTADGYARYRIRDEWREDVPNSSVILIEQMATNPAAHLDLWRFLLDIDLMGQIEAWNIAADDPLILNVAEPRRLRLRAGDGIWLRVVDVAAALAGRRYAVDGRLVIEVSDEFCPWNDGRWTLTVEGGIPLVEAATDAPDVACDITDVGAAYLGQFSFTQLADAGRARELQPGALARADALFHTPRAPWCPKVF